MWIRCRLLYPPMIIGLIQVADLLKCCWTRCSRRRRMDFLRRAFCASVDSASFLSHTTSSKSCRAFPKIWAFQEGKGVTILKTAIVMQQRRAQYPNTACLRRREQTSDEAHSRPAKCPTKLTPAPCYGSQTSNPTRAK